jgi:hypothetical protein
MAQQCELHGEAEPVGVITPTDHEILVRSGQAKVPRQAIGLERDAQEGPALVVSQQLSAHQGIPPSHKPPSFPWTVRLWET